MTIWVTGAAGMLGREVVAAVTRAGHDVVATGREVDITDPADVTAFWADHSGIAWVVNCAAWTAVDAAEENEEAARRLNVEGPLVLAAEAAAQGSAIVHISTDYVFPGDGERPYRPEDAADPQSAYGRTKASGEDALRAANAHHVILRTGWLYGRGGKNFVLTMLRLMEERDEIGVVGDQYGLPTYALDLAGLIGGVVGRRSGPEGTFPWGTYHYTNAPGPGEETGGISWYDFARAIYESGRAAGLITTPCRINALTTEEYPTPAARPAYSVLDSSTTVAAFDAVRPEWNISLGRFLQAIHNERTTQP